MGRAWGCPRGWFQLGWAQSGVNAGLSLAQTPLQPPAAQSRSQTMKVATAVSDPGSSNPEQSAASYP